MNRLCSILAQAEVQCNLSSHSIQIGAAMSAHTVGLPDSLIRTLGWWSSEDYLLYIHTSHDTLRQAAVQLASS